MTLTAGAGWGKTTSAGSWAREHDATWYALDASDRDPAVLAERLLAVRPSGAGHEVDTSADLVSLARQVAQGWSVAGPAALVLDDVHVLDGHPSMVLVTTLCQLARADLRILVTSRWDVGLVDDRRRGSGEVAELDATHLALDTDAVGALLVEELEDDRPLAARLVHATGGWPAALRLMLDALHSVPPTERSAAVQPLSAATGPVGTYLRGAVLPEVDDGIRRLLTQLALLGRSELADLAAVRGGEPASVGELATRLVTIGLARRDPGDVAGTSVVLPPVLQRALLDEHLPARDDRDALIEEVVDGLVRSGAAGRALQVLTATDHPAAAASLLAEHGVDLLYGGDLHAVVDAAAAVPPELRDAGLDQLHGLALAFRGEWSPALRHLRAAGAADEGELSTPLALAVGLVHHLSGDLGGAIEAYARGPEDDDDPEHAALLSWRATAHWLRGEVEDARTLGERAMAAARAAGHERAVALAHTALALVAASDGDRRGNESHYRQAFSAAERADDRLQQARILTNQGSHHLENGRYEQALQETDRAIDLAEAQGFAPILGVARCNRAETLLATGAIDEAIADAEGARDIFASIGSRNESYAHHLLGDARREQGELVLARLAYERAVRLVGPSGDRQGLVPAYIGLAKTLAGADPDAAEEAAAKALELDGGMARAEALLACAWVSHARGDREAAGTAATEALELATARENRAATAEAVTCLALLDDDPLPRLRDAWRLWNEIDSPLSAARVALGIARRADDPAERSRADGHARTLATSGVAIDHGSYVHRVVAGLDVRPRTAIRVLGDFVVEREGRPVPRSAWGSRKARDLLKVLVARGGRSATREELADVLWPDEPYDAVANRLSVALSVLRGVLTPEDAPADDPPIRSEGTTVRLAMDVVDVDADRFRRLAEEGLAAARRGEREAAVTSLASAEEAYGGDLLEDDRDSLWLVDRREELRSMYVSVARTLAHLIIEDDPDAAMRLFLRVLDRDPYDEPAHLGVCAALVRAGRHGEARRRHRFYAARMAELELPAVPFHDVSPSPFARRAAG